MTNKEASNLQEKTIAKYLGWSRVVASGSRKFYPGDIESDFWLGECKTHTKISDRVIFHKDVWIKIQNEAQSKLKHPVLFVDNGSQSVSSTYCMIPSHLVASDILKSRDVILLGNSLSLKEFTFERLNVFSESKLICNIVSLTTFKSLLLQMEGIVL